MVGIIVHHLTFDRAGLAVPTVFALINVWAIVDIKDKYMPMIK